jgi:hypothetical protein
MFDSTCGLQVWSNSCTSSGESSISNAGVAQKGVLEKYDDSDTGDDGSDVRRHLSYSFGTLVGSTNGLCKARWHCSTPSSRLLLCVDLAMKAELDSLVMNLTSTSSLKLTFLTTTADEDDDDDDEDDDDDDDDEDSRFGALTNSLHCLFTFPRTRFLAPGCNCLRAYCTRLLLFSSGIKLSSSSCSVDAKARDVDEEERSDSQTWQENALGTCKMPQS